MYRQVQVIHLPSTTVWYQLGEIYDVKSETKEIYRKGKPIKAYIAADTPRNRKLDSKAVDFLMCIGEDACVILGQKNKDYKSLLSDTF